MGSTEPIPNSVLEDLTYYAMRGIVIAFFLVGNHLESCFIVYTWTFLSDNVDLGTACGKYYRVCCLSIIDPGIDVLEFSSTLDL